MGRYLLFAWNNSFPLGGWKDYKLSHDIINEVMRKITKHDESRGVLYRVNDEYYNEIQIIDKHTGNAVNIQF